MRPKPEKDTQSWANFHPISLLNADVKVLPKLLANWLNKILHNLIDKDQIGFVPLRQAAHNIQWAVVLIHIARQRFQQLILHSLAIHEASNMHSWSYLWAVLIQRGFGSTFLAWIDFCMGYRLQKCNILATNSPPFPFLEAHVRDVCCPLCCSFCP